MICALKHHRLNPAQRVGETGPTSEFVVIFSPHKLCPLISREGKTADGELGYYHEQPGRAWVVAGQANQTGCSHIPLACLTPQGFSQSDLLHLQRLLHFFTLHS